MPPFLSQKQIKYHSTAIINAKYLTCDLYFDGMVALFEERNLTLRLFLLVSSEEARTVCRFQRIARFHDIPRQNQLYIGEYFVGVTFTHFDFGNLIDLKARNICKLLLLSPKLSAQTFTIGHTQEVPVCYTRGQKSRTCRHCAAHLPDHRDSEKAPVFKKKKKKKQQKKSTHYTGRSL